MFEYRRNPRQASFLLLWRRCGNPDRQQHLRLFRQFRSEIDLAFSKIEIYVKLNHCLFPRKKSVIDYDSTNGRGLMKRLGIVLALFLANPCFANSGVAKVVIDGPNRMLVVTLYGDCNGDIVDLMPGISGRSAVGPYHYKLLVGGTKVMCPPETRKLKVVRIPLPAHQEGDQIIIDLGQDAIEYEATEPQPSQTWDFRTLQPSKGEVGRK